MTIVRARMAPSPTGEYHIGHIRTVLYNYAFCKKNNGKFIIRIEDTDRERYVEGAVERILDVILDYKLDWDEGPRKGGKYGPYIQSERLDLYKKYALDLVDRNHAYYCFCTKERLDEMRQKQQEEGFSKTMYDGYCQNFSKDEIHKNLENKTPFVIRLKVPKNEKIEFDDEVYGHLEFDSDEVDDTILLKSDGYPTYHLAVVIDDHLMEITHIMRGNDWLPSTPKHVLLFKYFGWEMPKIVHLPNLKEKGENKKLSKRYGSVYAVDFLQEGYLVDALLNFLMFLGWNPGTEKEIYSMDEFISDFDIRKVHKTDLVAFDREKLLWINGYYIRQKTTLDLWEELKNWSQKFNIDLCTHGAGEDFNIKVTTLIQERLKKLSEFVSLTHYFYQKPTIEKSMLMEFTKDSEKSMEILSGFNEIYNNIKNDNWNSTNIDKISHDFAAQKGYHPKEAFMTLRYAITGEKATPPIFDILDILGQEESLSRIKSAIAL